MSYKDELEIRINSSHKLHSELELFKYFMGKMEQPVQATYTENEFIRIKELINKIVGKNEKD